jgi:hypothetical protein
MVSERIRGHLNIELSFAQMLPNRTFHRDAQMQRARKTSTLDCRMADLTVHRIPVLRVGVALVLLLLLTLRHPLPEAAADRGTEQTRPAMDPKAVERILRDADSADPLSLMQAALKLLEAGERDKAVFWFYAGQLRARYWPTLRGENAQLLTIFLMTIGERVNAEAFRDIPALLKTLDAVVVWDQKTFAIWATAMKLNPADPSLLDQRRKAVEGLEPYKAKLLADRETLEQYAREYKTPAQLAIAAQEAVNRNYSESPVEVNVAGTRFRLPANYISPNGPVYRPEQRLTDIGFWVFLPGFVGYTRDNWREPNSNPDAILIRVVGEEFGRPRPEPQVEAFLAEGGAARERVGELESTVYDSRMTQAPLPVTALSRHYVFKGTGARGNVYYTVCDAPQPGITQPGTRCEIFLGDKNHGLLVSAYFWRDHLARMGEIEERLRALLESWIVR